MNLVFNIPILEVVRSLTKSARETILKFMFLSYFFEKVGT